MVFIGSLFRAEVFGRLRKWLAVEGRNRQVRLNKNAAWLNCEMCQAMLMKMLDSGGNLQKCVSGFAYGWTANLDLFRQFDHWQSRGNDA